MTDRIHSLTLVLDKDIRIDDVQPLIDAAKCLRHVIAVEPNVSDSSLIVAEMRVEMAWREKILGLFQPNSGASK